MMALFEMKSLYVSLRSIQKSDKKRISMQLHLPNTELLSLLIVIQFQ